jgi:hypothetical protein
MASVLSSDGRRDPDVMAANATSAALMLSDIPWGGPIGVIRIGRICGQFVVNPTMDEVILHVDCFTYFFYSEQCTDQYFGVGLGYEISSCSFL